MNLLIVPVSSFSKQSLELLLFLSEKQMKICNEILSSADHIKTDTMLSIIEKMYAHLTKEEDDQGRRELFLVKSTKSFLGSVSRNERDNTLETQLVQKILDLMKVRISGFVPILDKDFKYLTKMNPSFVLCINYDNSIHWFHCNGVNLCMAVSLWIYENVYTVIFVGVSVFNCMILFYYCLLKIVILQAV